MNIQRSPKTDEAIRKVWMSYDIDEMHQGYELLEDSAADGDADAYCYLARCHMGENYVWDGAGFPEEDDIAAELLREAVRLGSADAVLVSMRCGELTPAVKKTMPDPSLEAAMQAVKDRADHGDAFSQYMIANVMFYGDYIKIRGNKEKKKYRTIEDYEAYAYPIAAAYYEKSFDNGLAMGFGNYRTIYESGAADICKETYEGYLKKLMEFGDPKCCNDYGKLLEDEYDDARGALHYYMLALERGDLRSAYNVGTCYGRGYGVPEDLDKAFEYYMIAAKAGESSAQFHVGNYYFSARGSVPRDYAKAVSWLLQAFESSDEDEYWRPAALLALCYQNGWGIAQNDATAYYYLSCLEDSGRVDDVWEPVDAMVYNALGVAYAFGRGAEQDIPLGIKYFKQAIEFGSEDAKQNKACFHKTILGKWKQK